MGDNALKYRITRPDNGPNRDRRGIQDAFIVCCDGLKGLPESTRATWPLADVQTCVVHLVSAFGAPLHVDEALGPGVSGAARSTPPHR